MTSLQVQLEAMLSSFHQVAALMHTQWVWPFFETTHFIGLTLLLGSIAAWDLRLLGMLNHVPVVAFHRLIPFAVIGFVINAATGMLFLMTYPDQYVYNSAFHFKVFCILLAGLNVAVFYATTFRRIANLPVGTPLPMPARISGAVSLLLWMTVIVCGRMITFFRPIQCRAADVVGFLADCAIR